MGKSYYVHRNYGNDEPSPTIKKGSWKDLHGSLWTRSRSGITKIGQGTKIVYQELGKGRVLKTTAIVGVAAGAGLGAYKLRKFAIEKAREFVQDKIPTLPQDITDASNIIGGTPSKYLPKKLDELESLLKRENIQYSITISPTLEEDIHAVYKDIHKVSDDVNSASHRLKEADFFVREKIVALGLTTDEGLTRVEHGLAKLADLEKEFSKLEERVRTYADKQSVKMLMNSGIYRKGSKEWNELNSALEDIEEYEEMPSRIKEARQEHEQAVKTHREQMDQYIKEAQQVIKDIRTTYRFQRDAADALDPVLATINHHVELYEKATSDKEKTEILKKISEEVEKVGKEKVQEVLENYKTINKTNAEIISKLGALEKIVHEKNENFVKDFVKTYYELQEIRQNYFKISKVDKEKRSSYVDELEARIQLLDDKLEIKYTELQEDKDITAVVAKEEIEEIYRHSKPVDLGSLLVDIPFLIIGGIAALFGLRYLHRKGRGESFNRK